MSDYLKLANNREVRIFQYYDVSSQMLLLDKEQPKKCLKINKVSLDLYWLALPFLSLTKFCCMVFMKLDIKTVMAAI